MLTEFRLITNVRQVYCLSDQVCCRLPLKFVVQSRVFFPLQLAGQYLNVWFLLQNFGSLFVRIRVLLAQICRTHATGQKNLIAQRCNKEITACFCQSSVTILNPLLRAKIGSMHQISIKMNRKTMQQRICF